jgi:hypothetical protein
MERVQSVNAQLEQQSRIAFHSAVRGGLNLVRGLLTETALLSSRHVK